MFYISIFKNGPDNCMQSDVIEMNCSEHILIQFWGLRAKQVTH